MKLHQWLDSEVGRTTAMAAHFDVTVSAITQWRDQVPPRRMREVRDFTEGAVDFDDMLPGPPKRAGKTAHARVA